MITNVTKISPQRGKVEGGEYIRIQGNGFNKDMIIKFDQTPAITFYSDSNNLFCKSPASNNLEVGSVNINLCIKDTILNTHDSIKFEYKISKEKTYLINFIEKLNKVYKMQFTPNTKTKTQELITHTQDIIDNLQNFQTDCSLNDHLTKLRSEFQVLMDEISSQSKVHQKNSVFTQDLADLNLN